MYTVYYILTPKSFINNKLIHTHMYVFIPKLKSFIGIVVVVIFSVFNGIFFDFCYSLVSFTYFPSFITLIRCCCYVFVFLCLVVCMHELFSIVFVFIAFVCAFAIVTEHECSFVYLLFLHLLLLLVHIVRECASILETL